MTDGRGRVVIEGVSPEVDCGRFPIKRTVGERVIVEADIFTDGHDAVSAILLHRREQEDEWVEVAMMPLVNDRWRAEFPIGDLGRYCYTITAWVDHFKTWSRDLAKREEAGQDLTVDLQIGAELIDQAAAQAPPTDAEGLRALAEAFRENTPGSVDRALSDELAHLMWRYAPRQFPVHYEKKLPVIADPVKARFSTWYEFFPRSTAQEPGQHGTFKDVEARLPYVASMGFDVLYLPPIHPIGQEHRKGKNNSVTAEEGDPGSPWAIGSREGGHKSIHPELGTLDDFRHLVEEAKGYGIDIAMDIAFQAAPDNPYVEDHLAWFRQRPDGTIQYAENPPKKYQDIYPFDYESSDWQAMWDELTDVVRYWCQQGVRIFRVDNPHTKAFGFWEYLIGTIKREYPEAIFLSEAFTRPKVMYRLAKAGFTQSYTYFTWRNTVGELQQYLTELTKSDVREVFRPNFWPNTPDILPEYLQLGGRPACLIRLILASTLTANYGMYGPAFELMEHVPVAPGREEYLNSEKYEIRAWDWDSPQSLREYIAIVNRIRHENPALQSNFSLQFHPVDNDQIIAYSKTTDDGSNIILTVVNLDPHHTQSGWVDLQLEDLGLPINQSFQVHDLLGGGRYLWQGHRNFIQLDPHALPGHIFHVLRRVRTERDFDYFL